MDPSGRMGMQKPKSFRRILSSCRSASDLEHFAKRHDRAFAAGLDLELSKAPCVSTVLYLFERVELEALFGLLREWTIAMLAEQDRNFGQLICAGKPCAILPRSPMALMAQRGLSPRTRSMRGSWVWRLPRPPMTPANPTSARPSKPCSAPWSSGVC